MSSSEPFISKHSFLSLAFIDNGIACEHGVFFSPYLQEQLKFFKISFSSSSSSLRSLSGREKFQIKQSTRFIH